MANPQHLDFEDLPGHVQISKTMTSPKGRTFRAVVSGKDAVLMTENPQGGNTIIVQGGSTAIPLLGGIVDGIGDALTGLLKILTCHMVTTTTVTCNDKGVVQKIETKTECVPG